MNSNKQKNILRKLLRKEIMNSIIEHQKDNRLNESGFTKYQIEDMAYELVGDKAINKVLTRNKVDKRDADTMYYVLVKAIEILKKKT